MAKTNLTIVSSDLSGETDAATITFGIKGSWYEIDLTPAEQKELEKTLQTYVAAGRKASAKAGKGRQEPETTAEQREQIRSWAQAEGLEVAERGRVPKKIIAAYVKANGPLQND